MMRVHQNLVMFNLWPILLFKNNPTGLKLAQNPYYASVLKRKLFFYLFFTLKYYFILVAFVHFNTLLCR